MYLHCIMFLNMFLMGALGLITLLSVLCLGVRIFIFDLLMDTLITHILVYPVSLIIRLLEIIFSKGFHALGKLLYTQTWPLDLPIDRVLI